VIRSSMRALVAAALVAALVATGSVSASADEPPSLPFSAVGTPTIAGTAKVGAVLTAHPGSWVPVPAFEYVWEVNGFPVEGSTGSTFLPDATMLGATISVTVTGIADGYEPTSRTSVSTKPVAMGTLVLSTPQITGTARVGRTLTAVVATSTPGASFSYRWYANGTLISGATGETLTLTASMRGKTITVRVRAALDGYVAIAKTSPRTAAVGYGTLAKTVPVIDGIAQITYTLCADPGTWTPNTRLTYRWYLSGVAISGATSPCLRVTSALWKNKRLTVVVTGKRFGYTTASLRSAPTAPIYVPGRTEPKSEWSCPSWAPIKGNASSMIYHMPWQRYYDLTKPEDCFSNENAAQDAGYRKAKV
jgi:hypothetical protein